MECNDDKVYEDGVNPTTQKELPVTPKSSPFVKKNSIYTGRSITQNKTSPFGSKQNPATPGAEIFTPKVSPLERANSVTLDAPVQVSEKCMDYVVKNFEDGDFVAFQDDTQYLMHLDNVII